MTANTTDELYDLRGHLERGLSSALNAELEKWTRENKPAFSKSRPRFEIVCRIGAPLGHRRLFQGHVKRFDMFNFSASIAVITNTAAENQTHPQMVSVAQQMLESIQFTCQDDETNWPFVTLLQMRSSGINSQLNPEQGYEQSTLSASGQFGIRPDAWPMTLPLIN